jgi:hypothetical protein
MSRTGNEDDPLIEITQLDAEPTLMVGAHVSLMMPDAISPQYEEIQLIPTGPDLVPRRMNPRCASRFKSRLQSILKANRRRSRGIVPPLT